MDYAVYDASRAGFDRAVFVIRPGMSAAFGSMAHERYRDRVRVHLVEQHLEMAAKAPTVHARAKPWGTAHAVLATSAYIDGGFGVVNADDFYGADAFLAASRFLSEAGGRGGSRQWANALYPLRRTRTPAGPVNRAICRVDEDGYVQEITETRVAPDHDFSPDLLVSMNFWIFTHDVFQVLADAFERFAPGAGTDAELLLPDVIGAAIASGAARVRALRHDSEGFGLTCREDLPLVRDALRELTDSGSYPSPLWGALRRP
jgi:hypothetical protein